MKPDQRATAGCHTIHGRCHVLVIALVGCGMTMGGVNVGVAVGAGVAEAVAEAVGVAVAVGVGVDAGVSVTAGAENQA